MARISFSEVDDYKGLGGNTEFFRLQNDKDSAFVHFMAENIDDMDILVVHRVKDERTGSDRWVSCLRKAGDPVDDCPLCAMGNKPQLRVFLQLYDIDEKSVKLWDRGKTFLTDLNGYAQRITPLYKRCFEIVRNGKAGDKKTRYQLFPMEPDDEFPELTLEDLPERNEIFGPDKFVLDKTYDELMEYNETGFLTVDKESKNVKPRVTANTPTRGTTNTPTRGSARNVTPTDDGATQPTRTNRANRATGKGRSY